MASCSKCGSVLSEGAAFCSVCGSPVSSAGGPGTPVSPAGITGAGLSSNAAAVLAYLGFFVTGIIFLVIEPYKRDTYVRFHAFQSIGFSVVVIVLGILWSSLAWMEFFSFGLFWGIFDFVGVVIRLAIFAFWLFLMYKAYNNERYMIPVIGEFASKEAGREG